MPGRRRPRRRGVAQAGFRVLRRVGLQQPLRQPLIRTPPAAGLWSARASANNPRPPARPETRSSAGTRRRARPGNARIFFRKCSPRSRYFCSPVASYAALMQINACPPHRGSSIAVPSNVIGMPVASIAVSRNRRSAVRYHMSNRLWFFRKQNAAEVHGSAVIGEHVHDRGGHPRPSQDFLPPRHVTGDVHVAHVPREGPRMIQIAPHRRCAGTAPAAYAGNRSSYRPSGTRPPARTGTRPRS